jgi:predicted metal-binding membrane protein
VTRAAGIPALRRWSRRERLLALSLLALATVAWLLTNRLAMPDMTVGILTGADPMADVIWPGVAAGVALFLVTWVVMMAAMMLPSIAPFTIGIDRIMRRSGVGRAGTVALTLGYFVVWLSAGVPAFLVVRGFDSAAADSGALAARLGAGVLLAAGLYQLTPLKRVCLRHCRSPALLLLQHGPRAVSGRFGAFRAGLGHGGYCLGCCWALMVVLLAAGVMSLVWMGVIAAMVALEKVPRRGAALSLVFGAFLIVLGCAVLIRPEILTSLS